MHCSRGLSVHSLKSLGDKVIIEQLFTVRDFSEGKHCTLEDILYAIESSFELIVHEKQVLKFAIDTLNIAYTLLEDLFIQFKEVAKVGELLNFEACMDMIDLLYEKEEICVLL
ncbi:unnamed protein product [Arabis nemorensis]|uniref:Uncharacterized protein n=1 Tax=Arabis nemorensis TaxID=586526 RepID=A0A565BJV5_9BRAS|nr:unnamed protein product [Arabis nemorensis]